MMTVFAESVTLKRAFASISKASAEVLVLRKRAGMRGQNRKVRDQPTPPLFATTLGPDLQVAPPVQPPPRSSKPVPTKGVRTGGCCRCWQIGTKQPAIGNLLIMAAFQSQWQFLQFHFPSQKEKGEGGRDGARTRRDARRIDGALPATTATPAIGRRNPRDMRGRFAA